MEAGDGGDGGGGNRRRKNDDGGGVVVVAASLPPCLFPSFPVLSRLSLPVPLDNPPSAPRPSLPRLTYAQKRPTRQRRDTVIVGAAGVNDDVVVLRRAVTTQVN